MTRRAQAHREKTTATPCVAVPSGIEGALALMALRLHLDASGEIDLSVTGSSMGGLTRHVSHLRVRSLNGNPPLGSVVVAQQGNQLFAHRVIAVKDHGRRVITKGDACPRADHPVERDNVLGIVVGLLRDEAMTVPPRLRRPWRIGIAWNSRFQNLLRMRFPKMTGRWDMCARLYKLWERIELWIP